jgi:DNA polymerase III alpha subunit
MSTNITNKIEDLVQGVLNHGPYILENSIYSDKAVQLYIDRVLSEHLDYPIPSKNYDPTNWFIPNSYKDMDIEEFLINQCPEENYTRLAQELELYRNYGMIPVLKAMKYIVDTLRSNNIVWGVGRGSSVASYVLFLIGVHRIDSVKYNLPIEEFFKGEQNG